jgi:hypothetical protein
MEINLKDKIIFCNYSNYQDMKKQILKFVIEYKCNKILFKGYPSDIDYKLIKKILPSINKEYGNFIQQGETIRDTFNNFIKYIDCKYCFIYKN